MSTYFRNFPKTTYDFSANGVNQNIVDIFRYVSVDENFLDDMSVYQYYQIVNGDRPDVVSNILYGTTDYYWTFFLINDFLKAGGIAAWPLGSEEFEEYMQNEYDGTCIITKPTITSSVDNGLVVYQYPNSLAGVFQIGETITGVTSGATGVLVKKDPQLSQMILGNVTGSFIGSELNGEVTTTEQLRGSISGNIVSSFNVVPYRLAPHHYVDQNGLVTYDALYIDESRTTAGVQPGVSDSELTIVTNNDYETSLNDTASQIRVVLPDKIYDFAEKFKELLNA